MWRPDLHRPRETSTAGTSPRQLSLALGTSAQVAIPRITENLFLALVPDDGVKAQIADLTDWLQRAKRVSGRLVSRDCLHLSLQSLGAHSRPRPDMIAAGRRVGAEIRLAPFEVTFDRVLSFTSRGGNRPPVLAASKPHAALAALHAVLGARMEGEGLGHFVRRQFEPHVTLLYRKLPIDPIEVAPITWTIRELVLVKSLCGQGRHIHVARWPLRDR